MNYFPAILLSIVVLAIDPWAHGMYHVPKYYTAMLLIASGWLWLSVSMYRSKINPVINISLIEILLLVKLVWLWFTYPEYSHFKMSFLVLGVLLLITTLARQLSSWSTSRNEAIDIFIRTVWVLGIIQSLLGLLQWVLLDVSGSTVYKTAVIGTIGPPNGYGIFIVCGILALGYEYLQAKTVAIKVLLSVGFVCMLLALILNGSRGAILSLIVTVILVLSLYKWNHPSRNRILIASVPVVIGFFFLLYNVNPISSFGRIMIWSISWNMFVDHILFGVGQGNFGYHYLAYQSAFFELHGNEYLSDRAAALHQPHNEFLNAFVVGGMINGVLFVSIWGLAMYSLIRSLFSSTVHTDRPKILFVLGVHCAVLSHALVDDPLHVFPVAVVIYLSLGFVPQSTSWNFSIASSFKRVAVMLLSLTLAMWFGSKIITEYPGYHHWKSGLNHAGDQQWNRAIHEYDLATLHLPNSDELLFHTGAAHAMNGNYMLGIELMKRASVSLADRNLYLSLAYANNQIDRIDAALYYAEKARAAFPDHLTPHLLLGEIYFKKGNYHAAKQALLKCIYQDTRVRSDHTQQIAIEAQQLWDLYFEGK